MRSRSIRWLAVAGWSVRSLAHWSACPRPASADELRAADRRRLVVGAARDRPVDAGRPPPGHRDQLHRRRVGRRTPALHREPGRLRVVRHRLPHRRPTRSAPVPRQSSYAYSYVPIVAGGTAFMYNLVVGGKKITDLRLSGETLDEDLHRQDHRLERPRDHEGLRACAAQPEDHRRSRDRTARARATCSPAGCGKQYPSLWSTFCHGQGGGGGLRPDRVLPAVQRLGAAQRLGPGRQLRLLAELRRGLDRLRRVRVRAEQQHPGREGAQQSRVLLAADAVERRHRVAEGGDRREPGQPDVPHAEPRPRLHER